ncbi:MAG: kinase [Trebouxia sp. A1-2]|nr:MAG: kinase [Trebouxia sp. A1-2]
MTLVAKLLLFHLLPTVLWFTEHVDCQSNSSLVFKSTGLSQALVMGSIATIAVSGDIALNAATWPSAGVTIIAGRHVTVLGEADAAVSAIDFGGIVSAIKVQNGAWLEFSGLELRNPAPARWTSINDTYIVNTAFAALPSINTEPNATVLYNNVSAQYYSGYAGNNPSQYTQRVLYAIDQLGTTISSEASQTGNTTITWAGPTSLALPASANVTGTANTFNLTVYSSTATCVVTPAATASGSGFPWWAGLILGLGLAAILALGLCCLFSCLVRRKRRRKAQTQSLQQGSLHGMQESVNPVQAVSPFSVIAANGHKPDDSAMIPKFSSAPEEGNIKPALGLARAGTSSAPPDVYEANMLINASNALSLPPINMSAASEGSSYSGDLHRRQSSGNEKTSAASAASTASQRNFRASAGASAASVPELFRQRSQMPLDEVELGPLLGRGAYGRVFKGRWKGALVAVKVIDHRVKGNGNAVDIQRETILSTSVVHPNVVSTYKIVTVNASRQMSDQSGGIGSGGRLTSHPENSATIEQEILDEELHSPDSNAKDEMQTWMLLEYCDRGSMEKACEQNRFKNKQDGKPDMINIYKSLQDIAAGMDYLHTVGVLHGDLKGANVLLKSTATDPRGFMCKLADFGLSRVLDLDMTHISTHTYGTISYMPPELLSQGKMTRAADVYSFGMLMWEIYTGSSLFKGLTVGQVFFMVVYEAHRPAVPEDCPEAFTALMTSCWKADPLERPTFQQITKDLQLLYGEARKKPLQSATSAPAGVAGMKASTSGPPAPAAPPLRVRPSTVNVDNSAVPRVGRSEFHSVTDAQSVMPRSHLGTALEQHEQPPSPFAQSGIPGSRTGTALEQDEKAAGPFAAVSQAPPPPGAQSTSPFDVAPRGPQQLSQPAERARGVPSLAEAQRRMAIAPTPFMPPQSMMRSNPRTSMTWRSPGHASLQIPEESDINALADQMPNLQS